MITVEHLTKRYGDHVAVDDLSFTVEQGEICGLLGPNGAGKSTTMNIMTGYLSATDGRVLIDGCDIFEDPEAAKKKIGYLPEVPPLYMDMTPLEYLRFVTALRKIPHEKRDALIASAIERTDIGPVIKRLIKNLSKGYRQRVGIPAALAVDPSVIILDEPTVGLDPKQIIEIRELIRSLGKEHTVLLSSHILSEVSAICNKVLILSHGKLVAYDTPENLEKRALGSGVLSVTAIGSQEAVREALCNIFEYSDISFAECEEAGSVCAHISGVSQNDRRAEVSLALASKGIAVTDLHLESLSLEDVFLELTQTDVSAPSPDETDDSLPHDIALDADGKIVLRVGLPADPESAADELSDPDIPQDCSSSDEVPESEEEPECDETDGEENL